METHVITIKPHLQIVDIGNGCKAYAAIIYILAKSELTATLQSITRSQFFLDYNFKYTNASNFLIWYKSDFTKLMTKEIETLKAKMLKLPTMSVELFDNVLKNINEDYPFSLSPKLILALLIITGICVIAIGIIFMWYKRETSLTSSTVGNLIKLVPSINEKIPTLNSLLPILSELTPSHNDDVISPVAVSHPLQTPLDELILPPTMVPKLQMETMKPSTTASIPYHPFHLEPSSITMTNVKTGPVSLEMFNHATTDLDDKGINNLRRYNKYLYKKQNTPNGECSR